MCLFEVPEGKDSLKEWPSFCEAKGHTSNVYLSTCSQGQEAGGAHIATLDHKGFFTP